MSINADRKKEIIKMILLLMTVTLVHPEVQVAVLTKELKILLNTLKITKKTIIRVKVY